MSTTPMRWYLQKKRKEIKKNGMGHMKKMDEKRKKKNELNMKNKNG